MMNNDNVGAAPSDEVYRKLCVEEQNCLTQLEELLPLSDELSARVQRLKSSVGDYGDALSRAERLQSVLTQTAGVSEKISRKVRRLERAKTHIELCIQRIDDILDLKFCTEGVQAALYNEDYEQAAALIHRCLALDKNLILRVMSDSNESSALEASYKHLKAAEARLRDIVENRFTAAIEEDDVASVERYFKLYPLLGLKKTGLDKFTAYLSQKVTDYADKVVAPVLNASHVAGFHLSALKSLLDFVAQIVEVHQPLVETYYGPGQLTTFIQHLQCECDRQAGAILRSFQTVHDFDSVMKLIRPAKSKLNSTVQNRVQSNANLAKLQTDPRELDPLLVEITHLNMFVELYLRFIKRRMVADIESLAMEERPSMLTTMTGLLHECGLSRTMQEILNIYMGMEEFYMKEMVQKAIAMDVEDASLQCTTVVGDVFFIIQKCVCRTLASSSIDGACAMLNFAAAVVEKDFCDFLDAKIRAGFPSLFDVTSQVAFSFVSGGISQAAKLPSVASTVNIAQLQHGHQVQFLLYLNNIDESVSNVKKFRQKVADDLDRLFGNQKEHEQAKIHECLDNFCQVNSKFEKLRQGALERLMENVFKPRMKTHVEKFLGTSYLLDNERLLEYDANDPWCHAFVADMSRLFGEFVHSLTSSNYDALVQAAVVECVRLFEKYLLKIQFNRFGGLQFDRDVRSIVQFFGSLTTYSVRDRFAKLTQSAVVLNVETLKELKEFWDTSSSITWRLTPVEVKELLQLRCDFKREDIRQLRLSASD